MTTRTAIVLAETTSLPQPIACQRPETLVLHPPCRSRRTRPRPHESALTRVPLSRQPRNTGKCLFNTTPTEPETDGAPIHTYSPETSIHLHTSDPRSPDQSSTHPNPYGGRALRSPTGRQRSHWHNHDSSRSDSRHVHVSSEYQDRQTRSYRLEVVQHPLKTAEFGTSTLTRLPLAPPLIAQLHIRDQGGSVEVDETELPFLVAQLSLYSADGTTAVDMATSGGQSPPQRLLYGNLVSSPHILRNLQGRQGIYFLFPDVSIRWRGQFQLNVNLIRLPGFTSSGLLNIAEQGVVLARARSMPFDVLSRNEYVAPAQTPLTQYFLQQGARMYAFASSFQLISGSR